MTDFLARCREVVGERFVLTDPIDTAPYVTDWRGRFTGATRAVIKPGSTDELAQIVRLCNVDRVPIVPQGGNTGLVLGSVPDATGTAVVLSTTRLNRIRAIDPINNTIVVEAGCILQNIHDAAEKAGRLFPLSLAAEGSCTIGGNLSTNAGGTAVLRYGNARELCLGLEVVTPGGEVWNGLRGLRKDNTGYDLRDLYIGAEGTLGIVTAAVLKLYPRPAAELTALVSVPSVRKALDLLTLAQEKCGATLTGFELMSSQCLDLVQRQFPQLSVPALGGRAVQDASFWCVLLQISDNESPLHAADLLEKLASEALERELLDDAIVASSIAQSRAIWSVREHIPLAQAAAGKNIKHDISLPISIIDRFVEETGVLLKNRFPGCHLIVFGHVGDGNLHYNVAPPHGVSDTSFLSNESAINQLVHNQVNRFGGSISAEHGLGALKREEILRYKSEVEMNLMRSVKLALDPLNIMNPGKVV
jgi:FAD/FMN-containing dehydrogenase